MAGRIEPVIKDGNLIVNGLWLEDGVRFTKKFESALNSRLCKFAAFNGCTFREDGLNPVAR